MTTMSKNFNVTHGSYSGAKHHSRELALWNPALQSADTDLLFEKDTLDARTIDLHRNNSYISGAITTRKDSIVGGSYRLNARPNYKYFGRSDMDEVWAKEFTSYVEEKFTLAAESPNCWFDAGGRLTLTDMIRLDITVGMLSGETVATAEWLRDSNRPFQTAVYNIDPARLENPYNATLADGWRKGLKQNRFGKPIEYSFRQALAGDPFNIDQSFEYRIVRATKPWGRRQVIHIFEPDRISQSRGVSQLVSALKQTKMLSKYMDVVLQNAVLNASYAAALESELTYDQAVDTLGTGQYSDKYALDFLTSINSYQSQSKNLEIDGVRIPVLHPGTKLKLQNAGQPGGVGTNFESSLLRYLAASLNFSYEEFAHDFTETNYSSARAAMGETEKTTRTQKKMFADRKSNAVYRLFFEEDMNKGNMRDVLPRNPPSFYEDLNADAYTAATWIGAPKGQIDELKETNAAVMRIVNNLSTLEKECARFGDDYRDIIKQRVREIQMEKEYSEELGIPFGSIAKQMVNEQESIEDNDSNDERENRESRS